MRTLNVVYRLGNVQKASEKEVLRGLETKLRCIRRVRSQSFFIEITKLRIPSHLHRIVWLWIIKHDILTLSESILPEPNKLKLKIMEPEWTSLLRRSAPTVSSKTSTIPRQTRHALEKSGMKRLRFIRNGTWSPPG